VPHSPSYHHASRRDARHASNGSLLTRTMCLSVCGGPIRRHIQSKGQLIPAEDAMDCGEPHAPAAVARADSAGRHRETFIVVCSLCRACGKGRELGFSPRAGGASL
jgi:hypothetical protein